MKVIIPCNQGHTKFSRLKTQNDLDRRETIAQIQTLGALLHISRWKKNEQLVGPFFGFGAKLRLCGIC